MTVHYIITIYLVIALVISIVLYFLKKKKCEIWRKEFYHQKIILQFTDMESNKEDITLNSFARGLYVAAKEINDQGIDTVSNAYEELLQIGGIYFHKILLDPDSDLEETRRLFKDFSDEPGERDWDLFSTIKTPEIIEHVRSLLLKKTNDLESQWKTKSSVEKEIIEVYTKECDSLTSFSCLKCWDGAFEVPFKKLYINEQVEE